MTETPAKTATLPAVDAAQYEALSTACGLFELANHSTVEVRGPDRVDYLQGLVSNDIAALARGNGCHAALLTTKGKMLADLRVLLDSDRALLDLESVSLPALLRAANMYQIGHNVEITDRSGELVAIALAGPRAREILGASVPEAEYSFIDAQLSGAKMLAVAANHGVPGVDLIFEATNCEAVRSEILSRGATPVGAATAECLRIEAGLPRFGIDMTEDTFVQEAGIHERAVSFTKGCYVGQEPVARMYHRGHPNRHLRGVRLTAPVPTGSELHLEGRTVGELTSATLSPTLGAIGLAIVRREVEPGSRITVGQDAIGAVVIDLPFG